jgi:integrase/recombinase XerC
MAYYAVHRRPQRTMTELEQAKVLKVTGEHARGFRDHVLFALALGTGLREHEALALDVGDITEDGATVKRRITLRVFKRCTKRPAPQEIFLPDSIHYKLGRLLAWKKRRGESLAPEAPLFVSREGNRLSTRMARTAFRRWQQRAGLDRIHSFHAPPLCRLPDYADFVLDALNIPCGGVSERGINQRPSRKARSLSPGWYRPDFASRGAVRDNACSFKRRLA